MKVLWGACAALALAGCGGSGTSVDVSGIWVETELSALGSQTMCPGDLLADGRLLTCEGYTATFRPDGTCTIKDPGLPAREGTYEMRGDELLIWFGLTVAQRGRVSMKPDRSGFSLRTQIDGVPATITFVAD